MNFWQDRATSEDEPGRRTINLRLAVLLLLVSPCVLTACNNSAASTTPVIATPAVLNQNTPPPKITLRQMPIKSGTPLSVHVVIQGLSQCTVTMVAIGRNGRKQVIARGADGDGPATGNPAANYMLLARVPTGSRRVLANATCRYVSGGTTHHTVLTAGIRVHPRTHI
jgi:hypothetical protein